MNQQIDLMEVLAQATPIQRMAVAQLFREGNLRLAEEAICAIQKGQVNENNPRHAH